MPVWPGPWDTASRACCHSVVAAAPVLVRPSARQPGTERHMHLIIAAALAVVAALAEFTVVPYLKIGQAVPHPVLVFGVIWAIADGLEAGLTWAFVGGLALDILGQRPLGSSAFSLLVAIGIASRRRRLPGQDPDRGSRHRNRHRERRLLHAAAHLHHGALDRADHRRCPLGRDPVCRLRHDPRRVFGPLAVAVVARRREAERADW